VPQSLRGPRIAARVEDPARGRYRQQVPSFRASLCPGPYKLLAQLPNWQVGNRRFKPLISPHIIAHSMSRIMPPLRPSCQPDRSPSYSLSLSRAQFSETLQAAPEPAAPAPVSAPTTPASLPTAGELKELLHVTRRAQAPVPPKHMRTRPCMRGDSKIEDYCCC
jgi:hypothetical protein